MGKRGLPLWAWFSPGFVVLASALSVIHFRGSHGGARPDAIVYVFITLAAGWLGALVGGLADWMRYGRSPLEPLFKDRFGWYYGKKCWFRFALVFGAGWAVFVLVTVAAAAALGAFEEARAFTTPKGILAVVVFLAVFALEGALVGGLADMAAYLFRKKG